MGGVKGILRSQLNLTVKPAAGAVGLVVNPLRGAWASIQKARDAKAFPKHREVRKSDGDRDFKNSSPEQRQRILARFKQAKETEDERKKQYINAADKALEEDRIIASTTTQDASPFFDTARPPTASSSSYNSNVSSIPIDGNEAGLLRDLEEAKQKALEEALNQRYV